MVRNGTVRNNKNSIPVMDFVNLKELLAKEYPGYRIKSSYFDVLGSSLSMSGVNTLNNLSKTISSQIRGDYPPTSIPPEVPLFYSIEIKPQNLS